jgi:hypothetical protein
MKTTDNIYFRELDDALAYIRGQATTEKFRDEAIEVCLGSHTPKGKQREFFVYFRVG